MQSRIEWIEPSRNQTGHSPKHIERVKGSMFNTFRKPSLSAIVVAIWNKVPPIRQSDYVTQ